MPGDHTRFAVFILTHGRPDRILTLRALEQSGYTGRIYLIVDNEDATVDEYRARYGTDTVIVFDKAAVAATFDTADTSDDRRAIVYARNACTQIARDLGLDYHLQLDDDYRDFRYRWFHDATTPYTRVIRSMDAVIDAMLTFLDDTGAATVAFSQAGDHQSGNYGELRRQVLRKAMNSFFVATDRPVQFVGRINEDVNTYVTAGSRGDLFLTVMRLSLSQTLTQSATGGMSDVYTAGTYAKSFYTVMMAPSCVTIRLMGSAHRRPHHFVKWNHAVPKILAPTHRKPRHTHPMESTRTHTTP